ncbi:MAG: FAD-dependent oxidoreductase [Oscillospiraceae bacterium]|nr:FAD-dependent oxidoreductase [Oscillospiraceae bacterium]
MASIKADIAIMGSGLCGLSAAITAAQAGAKVVLFEKQKSPGGSSNFFNGIFAVESRWQREKFIMYTRDEAFQAIMEYSHWKANTRLVRAIVDESATSIDWMEQQGVEISDVITNMPYAQHTYHYVKGHGAAVIKQLALRAKESGVDIHLGAPVIELIMDGGRIAGLIAEEDGEEVEVEANAVIIGSGGYANNKEWIKKYHGYDLGTNLIPYGNVDKMGDGIRLAWEAGAAAEGMNALELIAVGPVSDEFDMMNDLEVAASQPDLWVDPRGRRFCDEGICFYDTSGGNVNTRYSEGYTYRIIDDSIIHRLETYGVEKEGSMERKPGARLFDIRKIIDASMQHGSTEVFAGDSVEELAENMGIDPAVLKATIDEYNGFCAKRHDDLFAKKPIYLRALEGPRFYAVKAHTTMLGTKGGIRVNEKMEAVDKKDSPIKGLYAGGFDAAGIQTDSYPINAATGLSSAFAMNSGRIAARNAVEYIGRDG